MLLPLFHRFTRAGLITFLTLCAAANAQQPAQQVATNPNSADEILVQALGVVQRVDGGQVESIWPFVPAFVQQRMTPNEFVAGLMRERSKIGSVQRRTWMEINRLVLNSPGPNQPAVLCANVVFATLHSGGQEAGERVSVCHTPAGWRPTGYTVQLPQPPAQQPAAPAQPVRR